MAGIVKNAGDIGFGLALDQVVNAVGKQAGQTAQTALPPMITAKKGTGVRSGYPVSRGRMSTKQELYAEKLAEMTAGGSIRQSMVDQKWNPYRELLEERKRQEELRKKKEQREIGSKTETDSASASVGSPPLCTASSGFKSKGHDGKRRWKTGLLWNQVPIDRGDA